MKHEIVWFFSNHLFSEEDLKRTNAPKPWWVWPWLFILPTYVQINGGKAWFYKQWGNMYFLMKYEQLHIAK